MCEETFKTSEELELHQSYHHGKIRFSCYQCDKSFSKSGHLKTHIMIHIGQKGYDCFQCGKAFHTIKKLQRHQSVHTGEKLFDCFVFFWGGGHLEHIPVFRAPLENRMRARSPPKSGLGPQKNADSVHAKKARSRGRIYIWTLRLLDRISPVGRIR